jgi:hypothetical protein
MIAVINIGQARLQRTQASAQKPGRERPAKKK